VGVTLFILGMQSALHGAACAKSESTLPGGGHSMLLEAKSNNLASLNRHTSAADGLS
jgi:hypothetical protein